MAPVRRLFSTDFYENGGFLNIKCMFNSLLLFSLFKHMSHAYLHFFYSFDLPSSQLFEFCDF